MIPWLRTDPSLSANEQTGQIIGLLELGGHLAGQEQLVLLGPGRSPEDIFARLHPVRWSGRLGQPWVQDQRGARIIVKIVDDDFHGLGVAGVHPIAVYVDGFAPDQRLLNDLNERIRREIPGHMAVLANQPVTSALRPDAEVPAHLRPATGLAT